jgi:hypothetical protein
MAIIDPGNPAATKSASELRGDYLKNLYILREAYQKAIFELLKVGVKSYTIDTGQNSQTVTRQASVTLFAFRSARRRGAELV